MPENIYEILALTARYWFALLGIMIVWRAFGWLRKDRRAKHRRLKHLPDAGMIGEMVVLQGSDELPEGSTISLPRSGVMGFLRTCDVTLPVSGVAGKHVDFVFQDGKGLILFPFHRQVCYMDDIELTHRSKTKKYPMVHGSRLQLGEAVLRLRLFAGLDTEYRPSYTYEPALQPFEDEHQPQDWQEWQQPCDYPLQASPWEDPNNPWLRPEETYDDQDPQDDSWVQPPAYPPYQQPMPPQPPYPGEYGVRPQGRRSRRYTDEQ